MTRCAVAWDTPVDAAKAVMPAAVLPPACFAAMSPARSWLTLIPADAASAGSGEGVGDLVALADACDDAGLPDGEPGPDANAAAGTAIAVAVMTPAMARRWCRANMGGAPLLGRDTPSPQAGPKIGPPGTLKKPRNQSRKSRGRQLAGVLRRL